MSGVEYEGPLTGDAAAAPSLSQLTAQTSYSSTWELGLSLLGEWQRGSC